MNSFEFSKFLYKYDLKHNLFSIQILKLDEENTIKQINWKCKQINWKCYSWVLIYLNTYLVKTFIYWGKWSPNNPYLCAEKVCEPLLSLVIAHLPPPAKTAITVLKIHKLKLYCK